MQLCFVFFLFIVPACFTLDDTNAPKQFLEAINSTHDSDGYMCQLHDVAMNRYIMELKAKARKYHYKGGSILPKPRRVEDKGVK